MTPIPAPEAWENAIPPYGIRVPKINAPARVLPTAFERIGQDVSAALAEFGLPPVVSGTVVVAASAAARDAHWGVPASSTERRALQASGATTIRSDLGYAERYLAGTTDGGANPGGSIVAGWYPVSGSRISGRVVRSATAKALVGGDYNSLADPALWTSEQPNIGVAAFNGTWVVPFTGMWRIELAVYVQAAVAIYGHVDRNNAGAGKLDANTVIAGTGQAVSGVGAATMSGVRRLNKDDVLRPWAIPSAAAAFAVHKQASTFSIEFVEPARS